MKKVVLLVFILGFAFIQSTLKSQGLTTREIINNINTLLKTNPYVDNFLEITFYYSVDITSDNELVVAMESEGNFKSIFKTKISDLDYSYQKDFCKKTTNTISWHCKSKDITKNNGCVYVAGTVPGGGEANYYQDNIAVMFSNKNNICDKLYDSFNQLFTKVPGLVQSGQSNAVPESSSFILHEDKSISLQERSKYLYVGMEKYASVCHNNEKMGFQYDIVKNSSHSKAFIILTSDKAIGYAKNANVKENPQESSVCLRCHITGAGLDSSFYAATYKKEDGITCEACHKGELITKTFIPKKTDCLKCHNNSIHKISEFIFTDECAKIAHPRPKADSKTQNPISTNFESQPKSTPYSLGVWKSDGEKVDRFYFSTFHGGSGPDWAPTETCYIWFDDIIISENRKDVEIQPDK